MAEKVDAVASGWFSDKCARLLRLIFFARKYDAIEIGIDTAPYATRPYRYFESTRSWLVLFEGFPDEATRALSPRCPLIPNGAFLVSRLHVFWSAYLNVLTTYFPIRVSGRSECNVCVPLPLLECCSH